jgi:hypothetical protein
MAIRTSSGKTQRDYFLSRSPDTATDDDIRRFQFAQVEQGAQPPKMNAPASASRFFSPSRSALLTAHEFIRSYVLVRNAMQAETWRNCR